MSYTNGLDKPTDYFSTNLWVADDSSPRSFTGFGHQPDFVWVKHRGSASINHTLVDSLRGGDKMLFSNTTASEDTKSHGEITSFNSDGITVADGTNGTYPRLYFNDLDPFGAGGGNYVGWSWKAGGTASSNTDGNTATNISVNQTSGFSIVSYTVSSETTMSLGHGLNAIPKMIITKSRSTVSNWDTYHVSLGNTGRILLDGTGAVSTSANVWGSTTPTSSLFYQGGNGTWYNLGSTAIAYCFAEKKGYSKFSSYVGNGNSDGTFVYTGFKPAWIMQKRTDVANGWHIFDTKRDTFNACERYMTANASSSEPSGTDYVDILSNGFKMRRNGNDINGSGASYIYMAFASSPFVTSTSIPTTAR
jgi:hypothetical protein